MEAFPEIEEFGSYRLQAKIAQGGMADVYLATSIKKELQGQFIAIKRLLPHLNSNKAFIDLLIHEAKVGVLLNHPGIATVYDLGAYKSEFFIAMEYIHGKSLDRVLSKIRAKAAPKLPVEVTTFVLLEVLRALSFAHQLKDSKGRELNIIHRDISPGNILLGYKGEVKLVDFGIATAESRLQSGFSDSAMGKLAYMAPEQAVNDPVVKASDIYSVGVVLYELLTGQLPFQAENANALLKKVIDGKMVDIKIVGPSISQELRDIVNRCLERTARKRFQSCPELFQSVVEHFKKVLEIDFTSRATREYYRKRLSEYLRLAFESEMVQELSVVQRALREVVQFEEMKKTAPQGVRAHLQDPEDFDHTMIQPDLTEEATRHYPLTESERQKILKGIPPKEIFNQPTLSNKPGLSAFNMATVPEFETKDSNSKILRTSVKDRLEKSSLKKDQKETLFDQMPALEITTNEELEAFERNTLSGQVGEGLATTAMDRNQIFKDFIEIQRQVSEDRSPAKQSTKTQSSDSIFTKSKRPITTRPGDLAPPSSKATWISAAILSVLIAAGGILFLNQSEKINFYLLNPPLKLIPTQSIQITLTGEADIDAMRELKNSLQNSAIYPKLDDLANFFQSEFLRYTGNTAPLLRFEISEPSALVKGISVHENAKALVEGPEVFQFLSPVASRHSQSSAMIYLYVFSGSSEAQEANLFPEMFQSQRPYRMGVSFISSSTAKQLDGLLILAREIAIIYGAESTIDPQTNMPLVPNGLYDPKKSPVFPQDKADLMANEIPLSALTKKKVESLKQVGIGPYTAYRMGWITKEKMLSLLN